MPSTIKPEGNFKSLLPDQLPTVYFPLDPDTEEIRLLTIHPASASADGPTLRCNLQSVALLPSTGSSLQVPAYEALSYVWGEPDFCSPILLDGQIIHVTPNLSQILCSLRNQVNPRTLWVDAVCINQADLAERARQVQLMHKIYSSCQRVLAWMGPLMGTNSWQGFETPNWRQEVINFKRNTIVSGMKLLREIVDARSAALSSSKMILSQYPRDREDFLQLLCDNEVRIVSELLKHSPYWNRVWIVQELVCAPRITLVCGEQQLEWTYISSFLEDEPYFDAFHKMKGMSGARRHDENCIDFGATLTEIKQIEDQRKAFRAGPLGSSDEFLDVLARFRERKATDPRDKIYALMGLLCNKPCIEIDYTISLVSLYRETTVALMQRSRNLDIICQNPFEKHFSWIQGQNKGSWTADFGLPSSESPSILFAQRGIFNAGLREFRQLSQFSRGGKEVLMLAGSIIDSLDLKDHVPWNPTVPTPKNLSGTYSAWSILQAIRHEQEKSSKEHRILAASTERDPEENSPQPESSIRAFWRTNIRDCTAPPMMRRLTIEEIRSLDGENVSSVRSQTPLRTWKLYDKYQEQKYVSWLSLHGHPRPPPGTIGKYLTQLPDMDEEYMFATTLGGLFVLTRRYVLRGDLIAVLDGGKVPVILRRFEPTEEDGPGEASEPEELYKFICVAYVHGIMDGEVEEAVNRGWVKKREIMLV